MQTLPMCGINNTYFDAPVGVNGILFLTLHDISEPILYQGAPKVIKISEAKSCQDFDYLPTKKYCEGNFVNQNQKAFCFKIKHLITKQEELCYAGNNRPFCLQRVKGQKAKIMSTFFKLIALFERYGFIII
jgi:hypothetical protein